MKRKQWIGIGLILALLLMVTPVFAAQIRISGKNRYDTAVQVSREVFTQADYAILANGDKFVDALPGSTLANVLKSPILLVTKTSVPKETLAEMERVKVKNIYVLGGTATISEAVVSELKRKGYNVTRIGGKDRYETSELIYQELLKFTEITEVAIAAGEADAVSSSGFRGDKIALILVRNNAPSSFIRNLKVRKICLGGTNAISRQTYEAIGASRRIEGKNRFETATKIAEESKKENIMIVNGYTFVDAFTGCVFAYKNNADILLTDTNVLNNETANYIQKAKPKNITVLGGDKAVSNAVYQRANDISTGKSTTVVKDQKYWDGLYAPVLKDYRNFVTQWDRGALRDVDLAQPWARIAHNSWSDKLSVVMGYAYHDIDNNGIPELILLRKPDNDIYAIYSYRNGKPYLIESYWNTYLALIGRNENAVYIYQDGGGARPLYYSKYRLATNGNLEMIYLYGMRLLKGDYQYFYMEKSPENEIILTESQYHNKARSLPFPDNNSHLKYIPLF